MKKKQIKPKTKSNSLEELKQQLSSVHSQMLHRPGDTTLIQDYFNLKVKLAELEVDKKDE